MTCAELAADGLPAVYVPLPSGNGEQRFNALPVVEAGGGLLIDDADLTNDTLAPAVLGIVTEPGRLEAMSASAASHGVRDAAARLADMVFTAASGGAR